MTKGFLDSVRLFGSGGGVLYNAIDSIPKDSGNPVYRLLSRLKPTDTEPLLYGQGNRLKLLARPGVIDSQNTPLSAQLPEYLIEFGAIAAPYFLLGPVGLLAAIPAVALVFSGELSRRLFERYHSDWAKENLIESVNGIHETPTAVSKVMFKSGKGHSRIGVDYIGNKAGDTASAYTDWTEINPTTYPHTADQVANYVFSELQLRERDDILGYTSAIRREMQSMS